MIQVWIVEDHTDFRNAVRQEINDSDGLRCDQAFGSCEALLNELAKGACPSVILLDIQLPGLSGLKAISAVKSLTPNSQIIMLTMFDDQDSIFRALCAGASGYVLKTSGEQIADRLQLSYHTGDGYLRTIYRKLHVNNAPGAVARAVRERLF